MRYSRLGEGGRAVPALIDTLGSATPLVDAALNKMKLIQYYNRPTWCWTLHVGTFGTGT